MTNHKRRRQDLTVETCVHCDQPIEKLSDDMYRHRQTKRMYCQQQKPLSRGEHVPAAWPDDHPTKLRAPQDAICPQCKHAWWWHHSTIRPTDEARSYDQWLRDNLCPCRHPADGYGYEACRCENMPKVPVVFNPLIRPSDTVSTSTTESQETR